MTLGIRIKTLRKNANMTQENLADILSISPQAISRWETDVAMPDISLLPSLANLFSVTTDYLLGMEDYQKNTRKSKYDEAYEDYWKCDDKEANYKVAAEAANEYPGNMAYLEWLASSEYYLGITKGYDESSHYLDCSIKHYKTVIDNCKDQKITDNALNGIVLALNAIGDTENAKRYAMMQCDEKKRDEMLLWCLSGDERTKLVQKICERNLNGFLCYFTFYENVLEKCEVLEKLLEILFPDGNYQYYHNIIQFNELERAKKLCGDGCYDEAIKSLEKAYYHSKKMEEYDEQDYYEFTAPLFNKLNGKKDRNSIKSNGMSVFKNYIDNNRCFDSVRDEARVKEMFK